METPSRCARKKPAQSYGASPFNVATTSSNVYVFSSGCAARSAVKNAAEIVHRLLILRQPAQRSIHVQPEQLAFLVKIRSAPPVRPVVRRSRREMAQRRRCPAAAASRVRDDARRSPPDTPSPRAIARAFRAAAARGQHIAEIFRQAFVYPEQVVLHRLLVSPVSRDPPGAGIFRSTNGRTHAEANRKMRVAAARRSSCVRSRDRRSTHDARGRNAPRHRSASRENDNRDNAARRIARPSRARAGENAFPDREALREPRRCPRQCPSRATAAGPA